MRKLLTAFAFSAILTAVPAAAIAADSDEETFRQLELFGDIFERVRSQYVDETEDGDLIE
ncbi:MAG: peptidase S41, partial [Rhodospirillaceae bacterium]|nr:peptidase S41 [Rhodospirillaceae bacterium]